jgi:hypothetical protein
MNAVVQKAGNSETKSKPGESGQSKQVASAGATPEKQAAKSKKPGSAGSKSTGKQPAGKKTAGKKKTTGKKPADRKKTTTRRKSTTRSSGAAGEKPAAATDTTKLASLPIDPPPVTFPDAAAAADDPKSLSWMAQQAVSALNAVKAHQAEKGKVIMARAEKDKPEPGHADTGGQTGKPAQPTGAGEPGDAGQLQGDGGAESVAGSSGKENRADTGARPAAEQPPGGPQQSGKPASSGIADSPVPKPAGVPAPGGRAAAGSPPLRAAAKRRYPTRLLGLIALAGVVTLWLYFGADDEAVQDTNQPEQEIAGKPVPEPAGQSVSVPADKPDWQPAAAPAQFPEPLPANQVPESLQPTDAAVPVAASELTGVTAQENEQAAAATVATPVSEPDPGLVENEPPVAQTVVKPDSGLAENPPQQPVTPPGRRTPGYGYYPPQRSWQPPAYYRPGYSRPPSR